MGIVSSSLVIDQYTQPSGVRRVRETHTDSEGRVQFVDYELSAGQGSTEATANMNARVAYLNEQLAIAEAEAILGA